jgi:excisionase family DNA binding protein
MRQCDARPMNELVTTWLTVKEAAAYSKCATKTLYRAIQQGGLKAARVGGRRKIVLRREWIDAYLEASAETNAQGLRLVHRVA